MKKTFSKKNAKEASKPVKQMADTLGQAAALLGVPVAVLKAAKRQGAPGFSHSRVDIAVLGPWLKANPLQEDSAMSPMERQKFRKLKADADAKEFALAVKRGEYYPKADVRVAAARAVATARSVMSGKASGLALVLASVTGADPMQIEEKIKESNREIISELNRAPGASATWTCKHCGKESRIE